MNSDRFDSLDELKNVIEMGLDIEFFIDDVRYNISWENNKPFICICPKGEAVFFDDVEDLLEKYNIKGKSLKELWSDIVIHVM